MDLDKCLKDYTDEVIIDFLTKRREENLVPNIQAQLSLCMSMLKLARQLKNYPITRDEFMRGREDSFIEFLKSYILELGNRLKYIENL